MNKRATSLVVITVIVIGMVCLGGVHLRERQRKREVTTKFIYSNAGLVIGDLQSVIFSEDASAENIERALKLLVECRSPTSYLSLMKCRLSDRAVGHLSRMVWLKKLSLSWTSVTDADVLSLGSLRSLESLTLIDCPITDTGLSALRSFSALRSLTVDGTKVTEQGLHELQQHIPSLDVRETIEQMRRVDVARRSERERRRRTLENGPEK